MKFSKTSKHQFYMAAIILIFTLIACISLKNNFDASTKTPAAPEEKVSSSNTGSEEALISSTSSKISVNSPMTLSNNNMYPINGINQFLRLRMIEGKYYEDWNPGAYMGTIWEGKFSVELADEYGKIIARTDLNNMYKEHLIFKSTFDLQFDDYNNDNDLDFTLGQYFSSNGANFKLFTLRKDGKVDELTIKDYPSIFISKTTGYYSTKLKKIDKTSFSIEYYDNSKGKSFESFYKWDGKEFILNPE